MKSLRTEQEIIKNWKGDIFNPLVSICCITYNHEKYIEDALEGFLIQETDFPFEILIYDDASTDRTANIIREYEALCPTLIKPIYQKENQYSQGKKPNPEFNFPRAKGKYVALCEGDDYWTDRHKLLKQIRFLEDNPEFVIAYHDCQPFNCSGKLDIDFGGAKKDLDKLDIQKATPIYTLTACFRSVIKTFPPEHYTARYGDKFIWSLLGDYGKGKYMPEIQPAMYRIHKKGVHSLATKRQRLYFSISTYSALFAYHSRVDNKKIADYFANKIFIASIRYLGISNIFKLFINLIFKKFR